MDKREIPDESLDQTSASLVSNVLQWFVTVEGTTYADEVVIPGAGSLGGPGDGPLGGPGDGSLGGGGGSSLKGPGDGLLGGPGGSSLKGPGDGPLGEPGGSVVRVHCEVPAGRIEHVVAQLPLEMRDDERVFFNGYQTWTHSPEYKKTNKMPNMNHVPRFLLNKYHFDRYGDYHFVRYPDGAGLFHGFSWCYFRRGDTYRLLASLDERPGYTIFGYDANKSVLTIERDCAGVMHSGGELPAFDLFVAEGSEKQVFDAWFAALGLKRRVALPIKGYSSWYNHYEDITQQSILEDLESCASIFGSGDLFQIDDGWEPAVGDWLTSDPSSFPDGMKPLVEAIHARGFKAGLWLAPFVAEKKSMIFKKHPDWFYKVDGKPWVCGSNWSSFYSLDIDNPEVVEYLEQVFTRVFDEWGFDLVKLDFLYGAAPFGSETESRAGRMMRALEMLRKWAGDKLILGCGVPVMPAFGLVDYCRVGCDVSLNWNGDWRLRSFYRERVSTKNAIDDAYYRRQLDGRAYGSDPDVFFLRDDNIKMSKAHRKKLARTCAEYGSVFLTSDNPAEWSRKAKRLYKRLLKVFNRK